RVFAGLALSVGLVLFLLRPWLSRRALADERRVIGALLGGNQPQQAAKLLRALELKRRVTSEQGMSPELASLHFDRLLQRVDTVSIARDTELRRRRWWLAGAFAAASIAAILVLLPYRVFEGLNVLVARDGVAPLSTQWLEYPYVEAQ